MTVDVSKVRELLQMAHRNGFRAGIKDGGWLSNKAAVAIGTSVTILIALISIGFSPIEDEATLMGMTFDLWEKVFWMAMSGFGVFAWQDISRARSRQAESNSVDEIMNELRESAIPVETSAPEDI